MLITEAAAYPTLRTVCNPYSFSADGLVLTGTSGQNTDDVLRNSSADATPIGALDSILDWAHLAPTCPDTLGCFPYRDSDPFIMDKTPHVFFTANQDSFAQK